MGGGGGGWKTRRKGCRNPGKKEKDAAFVKRCRTVTKVRSDTSHQGRGKGKGGRGKGWGQEGRVQGAQISQVTPPIFSHQKDKREVPIISMVHTGFLTFYSRSFPGVFQDF